MKDRQDLCDASGREGSDRAFSPQERARLEERMAYLARRRFRFRDEIAAELAQAAIASFSESGDRYAGREDRHEIVVGILRNKCRDHIQRQLRLTAQRNAIRDVMPQADVPVALASGALDDIASQEVRQLLLDAVTDLRPKAREAIQFLRNGATRLDVMELIENTLEPRFRDFRTEYCQILTRCGIRV